MNIRLFASRTALTFFIAVASLIAGFSVAVAGPVGRDMDRDFEGSLIVPMSERAIEPREVVFLMRSTDRLDKSGTQACHEFVAVHATSRGEVVLDPCFIGTHGDVVFLVNAYRKEFETAYREGRRIVFTQPQTADRDSAEERADRRRAAKEFQ